MLKDKTSSVNARSKKKKKKQEKYSVRNTK